MGDTRRSGTQAPEAAELRLAVTDWLFIAAGQQLGLLGFFMLVSCMAL